MDKSERIILPVDTIQAFMDRCEILTDAAPSRALSRASACGSFGITSCRIITAPRCVRLMNRSVKTIRGNFRLPFARVHHIVAMIVDDWMLHGAVPWYSFMRPGGERKAAFPSEELAAEDIDGLYTEAVLMNY
jgi:hypothetical protein